MNHYYLKKMSVSVGWLVMPHMTVSETHSQSHLPLFVELEKHILDPSRGG